MDWQYLFSNYGYLLLFLILLVEGQLFIIFAGFLISLGILNFVLVVLIALPALIIGNLFFHQLAYRWGRKIIAKRGRFLFLTPQRILRLELFFKKHDGKVIFFSKFIYGLGRNMMIIAGLLGRPYKSIIKYDIIGDFLSLITFLTIGFLLGKSFSFFNSYIQGIGLLIIAFILLVIVLERLKVWRIFYKNNKHQIDNPEEEA